MKRNTIYRSFAVLLAITLLIFIVINSVAMSIMQKDLQKRLLKDFSSQQAEAGLRTAVTLKGEVEATQEKLGYVTQVEAVQGLNTTECNTKLKEIITTFGHNLGNLGRVHPNGKFYCSVNKQLIGIQASTLGSYIPDILNDPQHKPVMSRMIKPAGSDSYLLAVHVPVYSKDGTFAGTLGGAISVNRLAENYLNDVRIGDSGFVSVSDDNGDIIYNPRADLVGKNRYSDEVKSLVRNSTFNNAFEEARAGKSSEVFYTLGGERRYAVVSSVEVMPGRRWIISSVIPVSEVDKSLENLNVLKTVQDVRKIQGVVLLVCVAIIGAFLRYRIFKPIRHLDEITNRIQQGDLTARSKYQHNDELGRLGQSFNVMLDRLRHYNQSLQDEVVTKTSQVEKVLEQTQEQNQLLENTKLAVLNILEDLNEEKANVEAEKAKDEAILSSIGDGVFAIDNDDKIILFNKSAEKLTGYKAKEVIGQRYEKYLRFKIEGSGEAQSEFIKNALNGSTNKMPDNTVVVRKNGTVLPVEDSAAPIRDSANNIIGAIIVFRDVTEERALDEAKEEFVSIASHELRTPATAVKNFIGLLREGYAGDMTAEQKQYVELAYESNERELEIITSLLYVARSDAGRIVLSKQKIHPKELLDSVLSEQGESIKQRKQTLQKDYIADKLSVEVDHDYMRMALTNIVSNASKYTKTGGKVMVSVSATDKEVHIGITDTGVGIAANDKEKLFKKFSRIDNELSTVVGGNGLGLYLTKQVVDLHGGNIDVQSKPGKGTTFTVTLPLEGKDGKSTRR